MLAFLSGIQTIGYSPVVSSGYDEYPDVARLTCVLHVHPTPAVSAVWLGFTLTPPSAPRAPFQLAGLSPQPGSLLSSLLPSSNLAFSTSFLSCLHPFLGSSAFKPHPLTLSVQPCLLRPQPFIERVPCVRCLHLPHLFPPTLHACHSCLLN